MADVTVSIVSHGHGRMVRDLLSDLDADPGFHGADVVLTLNVADTEFAAADWPNLRLSVLRNAAPQGFGANHNQAFAACRTKWFLILNPDIRLREPVGTALLERAARIERIGVLAPRVVDSTGLVQDSVRPLVTPWALAGRRLLGRRQPAAAPPSWQRPGPFYWLAGMCLLVDSDAFRAVRGFDERFFLYLEDCDLCARLYLAGYRLCYESDLVVLHNAQRDSHRRLRFLRWHIASLLKHWSSATFWRIALRPGR